MENENVVCVYIIHKEIESAGKWIENTVLEQISPIQDDNVHLFSLMCSS